MRAVMSQVPPDVLAFRKKTGADQWDEVWEGVLHMGPMPHREHQDLEGSMEAYLRRRWGRKHKAKVYHQINLASLGGWPNDYRIPDLVLLTAGRRGIDKGDYFEGAPDVVVEIHSPGDESYEKLPFYAKLGVPEVWIIHRDTKEPEIHVLTNGEYESKVADADGWLSSKATGIEMRAAPRSKLSIRIGKDDTTLEDLPED